MKFQSVPYTISEGRAALQQYMLAVNLSEGEILLRLSEVKHNGLAELKPVPYARSEARSESNHHCMASISSTATWQPQSQDNAGVASNLFSLSSSSQTWRCFNLPSNHFRLFCPYSSMFFNCGGICSPPLYFHFFVELFVSFPVLLSSAMTQDLSSWTFQ